MVKGKILDQIEMLIKIQKHGSHFLIVKLETKASSSALSLTKIKELENLEIRIDTKSREKIITKLLKRKNHEDTNLMLAVSMLGREI